MDLQASKTASLGFFEALRVELAPSVTITIGFFGMIESEITMKGKIISENGQMSVNPEIMQVRCNLCFFNLCFINPCVAVNTLSLID